MSVNLLAKLEALNTNIKATFKVAREAAEDDLKGIVYDVTPVKGKFANIVALTSAPGMREFKSERVPGVLDNTTSRIEPRKWEQTLDVKREDIEDDELGQIPAGLRVMGINSKKHYGRLATAALAAGFVAKTEDGKAFFHADHKNLQTGVLNEANFNAARVKLAKQPDAEGNIIGLSATHLIVGEDNRAAAEALVEKQYLANGESNVNYKRVTVIVSPGITDTKWFVTDNSYGYLPVTIAERIKVGSLVAKTDLNSDRAFSLDIFSWGNRGRYDAAYVDYKLAVGSTGV